MTSDRIIPSTTYQRQRLCLLPKVEPVGSDLAGLGLSDSEMVPWKQISGEGGPFSVPPMFLHQATFSFEGADDVPHAWRLWVCVTGYLVCVNRAKHEANQLGRSLFFMFLYLEATDNGERFPSSFS